jgi:hypothetical protein
MRLICLVAHMTHVEDIVCQMITSHQVLVKRSEHGIHMVCERGSAIRKQKIILDRLTNHVGQVDLGGLRDVPRRMRRIVS